MISSAELNYLRILKIEKMRLLCYELFYVDSEFD